MIKNYRWSIYCFYFLLEYFLDFCRCMIKQHWVNNYLKDPRQDQDERITNWIISFIFLSPNTEKPSPPIEINFLIHFFLKTFRSLVVQLCETTLLFLFHIKKCLIRKIHHLDVTEVAIRRFPRIPRTLTAKKKLYRLRTEI